MKKWWISITLAGCLIPLAAARVIPLKDLVKPFRIRVAENRIFIADGASIYIYSAADYRLLARFGRAGEGPGEFKLMPEFSPEFDVCKNTIIVSSMGKVSFFTQKDNRLLRELTFKTSYEIPLFRQWRDRLLGETMQVENQTRYRVLNLYDRDLKKIREIHRHTHVLQPGKKFSPLTRGLYIPNFYILGTQVLVGGAINSGKIIVYDLAGAPLRTIIPELQRVPFTRRDRQGWINGFQINDEYKKQYEIMKKRWIYPEFFPFWQNFIVTDKKIYVQTFRRNEQEGKNEFIILDLKGKILQKVWLPLAEIFDFTPLPYTISRGKLYHFRENEEQELWELSITPIR